MMDNIISNSAYEIKKVNENNHIQMKICLHLKNKSIKS